VKSSDDFGSQLGSEVHAGACAESKSIGLRSR
jgi:hypothetical protein